MRATAYLIFSAVACLFLYSGMSIVLSQDDGGRIGVLVMGQVLPTECPVTMWFNDEPAIDHTLVVTKGEFTAVPLEDKKRFVRLYMPRTMEKLVSSYDFLLFVDTYIDVFSGNHLAMMAEGVEEQAIGAFLSMGGKLLSDWQTYQQWANSDLSMVFPHDFSADPWRGGGTFTVRINPDPSLPAVLKMFKDLGLEKIPGHNWGLLYPKDLGSVKVWGWLNTDQFKDDVIWMMSWTLGKGETWNLADDLDHLWWSSVMHGPTENPYSRDVMCNIVFASCGRDLPDDIAVVYKLRQEFRAYAQTRFFIQSLIDLLEGFGANMLKVQLHLREIDSAYDDARGKYMAQDFDGAIEGMSHALGEMREVSEQSGRIQRRALLWVYVVEWLAVSGTLMISSSILYILMVRRKVYKEVALTRRTA